MNVYLSIYKKLINFLNLVVDWNLLMKFFYDNHDDINEIYFFYVVSDNYYDIKALSLDIMNYNYFCKLIYGSLFILFQHC